jgi:hypothetical protein
MHYSSVPRKLPTWHAICAKLVEKKALHPFWELQGIKRSTTFLITPWTTTVQFLVLPLAPRAHCQRRHRAPPHRGPHWARTPRHLGDCWFFHKTAPTSAPSLPSPRAARPLAERTASRRPCADRPLVKPPYPAPRRRHTPMLRLHLRVDMRELPSQASAAYKSQEPPSLAREHQCAAGRH